MVIERDGMMQWMKEHLWFPLIVAILGGLIVTILGGIILQLVLTGQPPKFISDFFTKDTSVEDVSSEGNESIGDTSTEIEPDSGSSSENQFKTAGSLSTYIPNTPKPDMSVSTPVVRPAPTKPTAPTAPEQTPNTPISTPNSNNGTDFKDPALSSDTNGDSNIGAGENTGDFQPLKPPENNYLGQDVVSGTVSSGF